MEFKKIKNEIINHDFIKEIKSLILKHKYISILLIIFLIYIINTGIWTSIDGLITIGTLGAVIFNIQQNKKKQKLENQKIKIYFDLEGVDYLLNLDMPRKHISRSEIQGVLSAFQKVPSQRYSIEYLSDINFLDDIYKIQNNKLDILKICITKKEMNGWRKDDKDFHDGFNLNKMVLQ